MFKCNPVAGAQFGHGGISTPLLHLQFFHCEESVRGHVNEIKVFETDLNTGLCMSYPTLDFVSKQTNKQKKPGQLADWKNSMQHRLKLVDFAFHCFNEGDASLFSQSNNDGTNKVRSVL